MKKLIVVGVLSLLLTSCFWEKEDKTQTLINDDNEKILELEKNDSFEIPPFDKNIEDISLLELNNSLYSKGGDRIKEKIERLREKTDSFENETKAVFLESFIGDYKKALKNKKDLCKKATGKETTCSRKNISLTSYIPKDLDGNYIENTNLYIDGVKKGKFNLKNEIELENDFIHRLNISKEGYLDFYKKIHINNNSSYSESFNPKMIAAEKSVIIDSAKDSTLKSTNFTFMVKANSLQDSKGNPYFGKAKAYLFDIGEENNEANVFNLDAFSSEFDYNGYSMVTFGMPLIRFYDFKGNELYIKNYITGKGKIQNIEKSPGIDLVNVPKNKFLNQAELLPYNIPPFWNLDFQRGIWHESKMKILDSEGNYEFQYKTF